MKRVGSETAPTSAFPSATWERGESSTTDRRVGCNLGGYVDHDKKDEQKNNKTSPCFHLESQVKMPGVKSVSGANAQQKDRPAQAGQNGREKSPQQESEEHGKKERRTEHEPIVDVAKHLNDQRYRARQIDDEPPREAFPSRRRGSFRFRGFGLRGAHDGLVVARGGEGGKRQADLGKGTYWRTGYAKGRGARSFGFVPLRGSSLRMTDCL